MMWQKTLRVCVLAVVVFGNSSARPAERTTKPADNHAWLTKHPTIQKLLRLHNEERARYGLSELTLNPNMCKAAQSHAVWMAKTGWYQHSNLPWPEIIHSGPRTAEATVLGWIYSPAHHGNMLSGSEAGFGYMVNNGQTYWVGVFN